MEIVRVRDVLPKHILTRKRKVAPSNRALNIFEAGDVQSLRPTKKSRTWDTDITSSELPWKELSRPQGSNFGMTEEGGFLMLEEVEGVDVQYEDTANGGKIAKFKVKFFY